MSEWRSELERRARISYRARAQKELKTIRAPWPARISDEELRDNVMILAGTNPDLVILDDVGDVPEGAWESSDE